MKSFIWNLALALSLLALVSCENQVLLPEEIAEDETYVDPSNLPGSVQSFVGNNYPKLSIDEAKLDEECGQDVYEVELSNGIDLYFDLQGNFLGTEDTFDCADYDADNDDIDPTSLPSAIQTYIATNFPNDSIYEVERDEECGQQVYEVELSSGEELYFDLQGNFLGTDDTFDCDDDDDIDPNSLPSAIRNYLSTNHPNDAIDEVERVEECGQEVYEVELDSGLELYFDLQGVFLGTDDTFD
ncbi:MAG: PepSY-like domain-containing protein, partial [Bacteroidota bacterium]